MSYDPLPDNFVRLLRIQYPQNSTIDFEAEIEISLVSVPLAECPPYVTLSYTWGDPEPYEDPTTVIFTKVPRCYPIKCGDRLILCTRNLRNALRRLREREIYKKLKTASGALTEHAAYVAELNANVHLYWIDAVCIDQNDLHERSKQVLLMSQIYRRAQCTIFWYGEADAYTKSAVQAMMKFLGRSTSPPDSIFAFNSRPDSFLEVWQRLDDTEVEAFGMFMARKWILRTWIIQEVVLSPIVLIMCGSYSFPLDILLRAAASMSWSGSSAFVLARVSKIFAKRSLPALLKERVMHAQLTLGSMYLSRYKTWEDKKKPNFLDTVTLSARSSSTDLRDKIFGILGLTAEFDCSGTVTYRAD